MVDAIGALDNPEQGAADGMNLRAALYIADHIASGKFAADSFPVEEWKRDYLKSIGCEDQIPAWEEFFSSTMGGE